MTEGGTRGWTRGRGGGNCLLVGRHFQAAGSVKPRNRAGTGDPAGCGSQGKGGPPTSGRVTPHRLVPAGPDPAVLLMGRQRNPVTKGEGGHRPLVRTEGPASRSVSVSLHFGHLG